MNLTASDNEIGLDHLSTVEQIVTDTSPLYFRQYINDPDIVPADLRLEFDEQLISAIALSPEIMKYPPAYFSLRNKSMLARFLMFASPESMAVFMQGDSVFFWLDDERESHDKELQNDCEEICTLRENVWRVLTKAVHERVRVYCGETNDEYLWTSVYSEQSLDELLEYINKLMLFRQKSIEHPFRGEEIYPDDLLFLLDNPYCEFDPLDYTEKNILLKEADTAPDLANTEQDGLFINE